MQQVVAELSDITGRLAKIVNNTDSMNEDENNEILEKVERAIKKVNEKEEEFYKIAKVIMADEPNIYRRNEEKVITVLKAMAVSKLAGISEYKLSIFFKEYPEIVEKLGNVNIKNFYHAIKYTSLWKYRNMVYSLFRIKVGEKKKNENVRCTYCGGDNIIKIGSRHTARGKKQRYYCKKCNRSFVSKRDNEFVEYKKEYKDTAGKLYCSLNNLLTKDIIKIINKEYGINVSTSTVSRWINDYIHENLENLTREQKKMLVIKKIVELDGWKIDNIVKLIKYKWGYRVTHIKILNLISSYKKMKKNDEKIKEMIDNGVELNTIAEYFRVPKGMIRLIYGGDYDEQ